MTRFLLTSLRSSHHHCGSSHRSFSSFSPTQVALSFDHYRSPSSSFPTSSSSSPPSSQGPLIILHGLFGSKQNWQSLAKQLSQRIGSDVYTLDLRNHGESPATPGQVSYTDYASDVKEFIDTRKLHDVTLIGHSMGGKVAMSLALQPHSALSRLVVVDIAPAIGNASREFLNYIHAMRQVDEARVKSKKEADEILSKTEPDPSVRQFILTNLKHSSTNSTEYRIRLPLPVLTEQLDNNEIGLFPYQPGERSWQGPTLFVKGSQSKYINRKSMLSTPDYFPNHVVKVLEAGHWVHAEKPHEFIGLVADFVQGHIKNTKSQ